MIIFDDDFPLANDLDVIVPLNFNFYYDSGLYIHVYKRFAEIAQTLDQIGGSPLFEADTLKWLCDMLAPEVAKFGYKPDAEQCADWNYKFVISSPGSVNRQVIKETSLPLDGDFLDSAENLTSYDLRRHLDEGLDCFVTLLDGKIVSVASSNPDFSRAEDGDVMAEDGAAVEIGVETAPGYYGRGFAASNAAALALKLSERGNIVLFTCGSTNIASYRTAEKAGFRVNGKSYYFVCYKE